MLATRKRNDCCTCGSGRKYKRCCLRRSTTSGRIGSVPGALSRLGSRSVIETPQDGPPITNRTVWKELHLSLRTVEANWRAVLLYSADWLRLNKVDVGSHLIADLTRVQGRAEVDALFDTAAKSDSQGRLLSVGRFPADRPLPEPKPAFPVPQREDEPHPDTHRAIWLYFDKGGGDWLKAGLLRSLDWIRENNVRVGGTVRLNLEEMGAVGEALVERIEPCPVPEPGPPGRGLVTGVFEHSGGQVGELRVEGEPNPIGVTPGHLFWSEDRQDFVPVDQLLPGERLLVRDGTTRVIDYILTDRVEPMYNIEVQGDHVYRVGEQGILVHNASNPCTDGGLKSGEELIVRDSDIWLPDPRGDIDGAESTIKYTRVEEKIAYLKRGKGNDGGDISKRLISGEDYPKRVGIFVNDSQPGRDTVGHIVPKAFGGMARYPAGIGNIFPQEFSQNNTTDATLVNTWVRLIEATPSHCVCVKWTFKDWETPRNPGRPRRYVVEYFVDGDSMPTTVRIENPHPK